MDVVVKEPLYRWSNWKLLSHSDDFKKDSARLIHFNVTVPRDGERVIRYRVHYSW